MPRVTWILLAGSLLLAGCSAASDGPDGAAGPGPAGGLSTPTPVRTAVFDCGRAEVGSLGASARRTRLATADVCLRDALLRGQPARFARVGGGARTTYQVTGRGEVEVTEEADGRVRHRRCTGATGLFLLGRCTREPGPTR